MKTNLLQTYILDYYTQMRDFQSMSPSSRNWLLLGFLAILSFVFVWFYEYSRRPKIAQIPFQDLRLSPAQVSFLLEGVQKAEYFLASTFLDWKRRGFIEEGSFSSKGFTLLPFQGPLLENEIYLMRFLMKICHSRKIDFTTILHYRKKTEQNFYMEMNQWFLEINKSLSQRQLSYEIHANHGHSLVYGLLSITFFFLGFIGLYLGEYSSLLLLIGASFYCLLGISIYGKYPPKGQAVFHSLIPIRDKRLSYIKKELSFLDEDILYLYGLSMGRFFNDLAVEEKLDPNYIEQIRKSFIQTSSFHIFK